MSNDVEAWMYMIETFVLLWEEHRRFWFHLHWQEFAWETLSNDQHGGDTTREADPAQRV